MHLCKFAKRILKKDSNLVWNPFFCRNSTTQKTLASKSKYIGTPRDASNARKSSIQQNVSCRSHKANTSGSFTFLIESVNFELGLEIVCDRNQVLVLGTETKVQFWYHYFFPKLKLFSNIFKKISKLFHVFPTSVLVTVLAESISQFRFQFCY